MITTIREIRSRQLAIRDTRRQNLETLLLRRASTGGGVVPSPTGISLSSMEPSTGPSMGEESPLNYFKFWTYACINAIATRVAGLSWHAGDVLDASPNPERHGMSRNKVPKWLQEKLTDTRQVDPLPNHDVLDVLAKPNPLQPKYQFLYFIVANLQIEGQVFLIGGRVDDQTTLLAVPRTWMRHDKRTQQYAMQPPGSARATPLPPECVRRIYLPHVIAPGMAWSPARSCFTSIKTDDYIQDSQYETFEHGIRPNLMITIGKGNNGERRRLTGPQRDQIIRTVRQVWSQSQNLGDPAIIDGLIESVHKLHPTPQEMDWPASGQIVKDRILQAHRVNPYILGQVTDANKAQAVVAESVFNTNVINPMCALISEAMTEFVGPWYDSPQRLVVYLPDATVVDRDTQLKEWATLRSKGDVTRDEIRRAILDLAPIETEQTSPLVGLVGGVSSIVTMMQQMALGFMTRNQILGVLTTIYKLSPEEANAILADGGPPVQQHEDPQLEPPLGQERSTKAADEKLAARKSFAKRYESTTRSLELDVHRVLNAMTDVAMQRLEDLEWQPDTSDPDGQAMALAHHAVPLKETYQHLLSGMMPGLMRAFVDGASHMYSAWQKDKQLSPVQYWNKKTTAQDFAERYEIEVEPEQYEQMYANALREVPQQVVEQGLDTMMETFSQPYWESIPVTSQTDLMESLRTLLKEGHSVPDFTKQVLMARLKDEHGVVYNRHRAKNIARTESGNMLNAGESAVIENLAETTGLDIRKEWLSALGSTTRNTHADTHGKVSDTDGMFTLAGQYRIPWPAHYSLPAAERCNCQCSILSTIVDHV